MSLLNKLLGRKWPVYHRVPHKNRKDAPIPCSGVAFYRYERGPVPISEIPQRCDTCGQMLQQRYLDWHAVIDRSHVTTVTPVGPITLGPVGQARRRSRHYGQIVTEQETRLLAAILKAEGA